MNSTVNAGSKTFEAQNVYKKQLNVDSRVEWDRQCDRICRNLCIPIGKMLKVFGNIFRVIKYLATLKTHYVIFSLLWMAKNWQRILPSGHTEWGREYMRDQLIYIIP